MGAWAARAIEGPVVVFAVLAFVLFLPVGLAVAVLVGPDIHVHYVAGDEPAAEPDARSWALGPGATKSTAYGTTRRHAGASLAGYLRLDAGTCNLARTDWTVTADSQEIGRGTLSARDWSYNLDNLHLPGGRTPSALVIAASRADEADCDAELRWVFPSYDAPGIGPIWPTELSARQIFLVVFLSLAGMVTAFLLCMGLAAP